MSDYTEIRERVEELYKRAVEDYCYKNACNLDEGAKKVVVIINGVSLKIDDSVKPWDY